MGNGASTVTGVVPTGTVAGDLMVAMPFGLDGAHGNTQFLSEAGWTEPGCTLVDANPNHFFKLFTKIAGASESNPTFDMNQAMGNNPEAVCFMASFAGPCQVATFGTNVHDVGGTFDIPGLTIAAQPMYLLAPCGFSRGATSATSTPSGYGQLQTSNGSNMWAALFGKAYSLANPASAGFTMNNGGAMNLVNIAIIEAAASLAHSFGVIV